MQVAALFLHNLRSGFQPAWLIDGANDEDKAFIDVTMLNCIGYVEATNVNEWQFSCFTTDSDRQFWTCKRFSWDMCWSGTLEEILQRVKTYYRKG